MKLDSIVGDGAPPRKADKSGFQVGSEGRAMGGKVRQRAVRYRHMPPKGFKQAVINANATDGPISDVRMWTFLAIRPWCRSDLEAIARLGLPEQQLMYWHTLPFFVDLERQAAAHMADLLWLPKQRLRALMADGVDELSDLLHFGPKDSIGAAKVRLEALRILFSSNGLMARALGDDPRATASAPQGIPLDALTDAELESLSQMAHGAAARLLARGERPARQTAQASPTAGDESESNGAE
jgi:hypothetical protein